MEWGQVLTIAAINIGLIAWLRADMNEFRKETKDFHGRLCALEEKYHQILQRIWEKK